LHWPGLGNARMNSRDVRALGSVLTRDVFAELARSAFLRRRKLSIDALRGLGRRWQAIQSSLMADRILAHETSMTRSPGAPLSKRTGEAVVALVDELVACSPQLYSQGSLRERCLGACGRAIASCALSAILACISSSDGVLVGDSERLLFLIACWNLVTTIQLWRTYTLVKHVSQRRRQPIAATAADSGRDCEVRERRGKIGDAQD
jgi:hypothetical protein